MTENYITGTLPTVMGAIPKVSAILNFKDHLGAVRVRWSINRNNYKVQAGLYAVGSPGDKSDVFVSANYKLSFDHLRKNLDGLDAWILVLDTKGVNVWCAAGKGTFGTRELVSRISATGLANIVSHRRLIVPQLGATGVSAYQVKELTSGGQKGPAPGIPAFNKDKLFVPDAGSVTASRGFNVLFGPIKASDIKEFIARGYKASSEMRKVNFTFSDRLKLVSVDFVNLKYRLLAAFAIVFLLSGLSRSGISLSLAYNKGLEAAANLVLAYFTGIIITPLLLPYIPLKMFAFKGLLMGFLLTLVLYSFKTLGANYFEIVSWFLILPGISSFMAMNFTGASTFTSLSGVKKEMRIAVPVQISFAILGLALFVIGKLN